MGSVSAMAIASEIDLTLEQQLGWHLQANHYPPIPKVMIQPCIEAIDAYWNGDLNAQIPLPFDGERDGKPFQILWQDKPYCTAIALIEHAHLDAWLVDEDIDYEDQ